MNKIIMITAIVLGLSFPAFAENDMEVCASIAEAAKLAMELRQMNIPMIQVLKITEGHTGSEAELMRGIILEAYNQPRFSVDKNQKNAVTDFENKVLLECLKARSSK